MRTPQSTSERGVGGILLCLRVDTKHIHTLSMDLKVMDALEEVLEAKEIVQTRAHSFSYCHSLEDTHFGF